MARDTTKFQLGPCQITVDGTDVGYTMGETTVTIASEQEQANPDQAGGPVEAYEKTCTINVSGQFMQTDDLPTLMELLLPGATVAGDKVTVGRVPGYRASQNAFELVLHPEDMGDDTSQDLTIYKALSTSNTNLAYTKDSMRVYNFEFYGLYDLTRDDGEQLFAFGESDDAVAPTRTTSTPTHEATDQAITVTPSIKFSEAMSRRTLIDSAGQARGITLYNQTDEAIVACTAAVTTTTNANDTITLTPDASLGNSKVYILSVNKSVTDTAGNAHAGSISKFTTVAGG